jgi:hypothetical protein
MQPTYPIVNPYLQSIQWCGAEFMVSAMAQGRLPSVFGQNSWVGLG